LAKKSFELDPEFHIAHYTLGRIYFEDHQFEKAAEAFEHVVKVYPNLPEVHHFLGLIYANQRRFDRAVSEFEWDIRITPDHALAHLNVGQIYWHEFKNRDKAIGHLKAALAIDPFLPERRHDGSAVFSKLQNDSHGHSSSHRSGEGPGGGPVPGYPFLAPAPQGELSRGYVCPGVGAFSRCDDR
jgi:tetratricopeptide (TPR) repeat protein